MITAIIPARAGSKGIKRKNMIPLCGKPLIGWSIEQARAADMVDEVIVATDSEEIGQYALSLGAHFFLRSKRSATDTASSEMVLLEVLESLEYEPKLCVFLQATSPIRQPTDIDSAIHALAKTGADSLFSGRRIEGYTWTFGECLTPNYQSRKRRQNQTIERIEENGSIYVFRPWVLRRYGNRLGGAIACHEMHPLDSFQIDEPRDVELFEMLLPMRLAGMVVV